MLKRKMLRDIANYKVQFISIFLMAFIGVFVFTGTYVETASFETTIDDYYNETNMADGWIYSNYLVDEFLYAVNHLGATTQMERQLVVDSLANFEDKPHIRLHFVENNTLSKFYLLEGKKLDIGDSEGVWLDKSFADARNLKIGDEISFESNGVKIQKEIRGLGYSPEYVYYAPITTTIPNHTSNGFAYMSHKAFPSDNITYNVLNVKFDGTPETYLQLLSYRLGGYFNEFLQKSNHFSVIVVSESISQQKSLSSVFPSIFIIISMIMLSATMKRIISHQRYHIGILKANGFKNNKIIWHYILPGFILVTLGSIFGAVLGPLVFHIFANPSRILYFKFPYWNSIGVLNSILIILVMAIISLIVSYYSIARIIKEPPAFIINQETPKTTNRSFIEKLNIWKKLPFNVRWNYRMIKRNKFRTIVTILGVIGCTVLLISGVGLYEQMGETKDWYFNDVNHFESKLIIDEGTNLTQINSVAQKVNGTPIMESSIEIVKDQTELRSLLVWKDSDLITLTDDNHDKIKLGNDEVSVSQKMADKMNISVGDTIDARLVGSDKNIKIKVDKIHSSPFSQGLVMSPDKLNELGLNYTPTSIISAQHVTDSYAGINSILYLNDLMDGWDQLENISMMIISALVVFGVMMALVILYNLNILSYTEMENDIVTLKTLGFKSAYLTKILATQSLFFIIIGFIIGVPVGYYVLSIFMPAFGEDIYLVPSISATNIIITFMIIMAVSVIMIVFFSHKIKKFDMVNSLKFYQ